MEKSAGERAGKAVQENHPELINLAGVIGLSALDIFSYGGVWQFFGFAGLSFISIPLSWLRNKALRERIDKVDTLEQIISKSHRNYFDLWDDKVREIAQALSLDHRQRISIYKKSSEEDEFHLLGRHSEDAEFRKKHRLSYPSSQGVVGEAWRVGYCFEPKLPNPQASLDRYVAACETKYRMPADITKNLAMKSTCLWGTALRNEKGLKVAVIVIESTKRDDLDEDALKEAFAAKFEREVELMLKSLEFMEPSINLARRLGV